MRICGIICEFNPFHDGHACLFKAARDSGAELIVCAMSGHITQRAEPAVTDKYTRAASALRCGADLVLELPYPFCAGSAEFFAKAGVGVLQAAGADTLLFGCECGSLEKLQKASAVRRPAKKASGNRPDSYFSELAQSAPDGDAFGSNDLLGIAYLKAIAAAGRPMEAAVCKRDGADYLDASLPQSNTEYPSSTALRKALREGTSVEGRMPADAYTALMNAAKSGLCPSDESVFGTAAMTFLRLADPASLKDFAECGGGTVQRLCKLACACSRYEDFLQSCATKTCTRSRAKRAVLFAMTGVTFSDLDKMPAYTQVLGANQAGRKYLSSLRKAEPAIPFLTKPADAKLLGPAAVRQAQLGQAADALFTLSLPAPLPKDAFLRARPVLI